jgi:hypothetical protein
MVRWLKELSKPVLSSGAELQNLPQKWHVSRGQRELVCQPSSGNQNQHLHAKLISDCGIVPQRNFARKSFYLNERDVHDPDFMKRPT